MQTLCKSCRISSLSINSI